MALIKEVVITHTNKSIVEGGKMITYGEFLVCISISFMTETIQDFQRSYFWINSTIYPSDMDPYCFNDILPWKGFEETLKALTINDKPPP